MAGLAAVCVLASGCSSSSEIAVKSFGSQESMTSVSESYLEPDTEKHAARTLERSSESEADGAMNVEKPSLIAVYVCGAVRKPDVYYLPEGSRIYDALKAAGGFSIEADTQWLNQAQTVTDGEMLFVYTLDETARMQEEGIKRGSAASGGVSSGDPSGSGGSDAASSIGTASGDSRIVNLNQGTKEELMTLPGIGESKADAIIRYRTENGPFASVEDIMNISGIKNSTFEKIKDRIAV